MATTTKKKKKLSLRAKRAISGYLFIMPWLLGFCMFYIRCLFMTFQFSFNKLTVSPGGGYVLNFVGFDNYVYAFRAHATYKQVLVQSLGDMLIDVPLIIFFALFMAIMLNRNFKGRSAVRAIFFLPVIFASGAIRDTIEMISSMMAGGMGSSSAEIAAGASSGMDLQYYINMFAALGLPESMIEYVSGAVGRISDIINKSGVQIVLFIAALQSIPGSLYEVAKIEGATGYETFWKVTFPMVMPHIITSIVYTVVDSFADSKVVDMAYDTAFGSLKNYGLSSVMSICSTVATCVILFVVVKLISKRTFYYN